jgi:hypothetical protein
MGEAKETRNAAASRTEMDGICFLRRENAARMVPSSVHVQIAPESVPSVPPWLGEVAVFAHVLTQLGILNAIQQQVRFARARFGQYDTIDFVVVLIGYAVSGEPTLQAFYERLLPFATPFMALFGRRIAPREMLPAGAFLMEAMLRGWHHLKEAP